METKTNRQLSEAVSRLKKMYRDQESTDFIAMEFLVSPEILGAARPGSVLWDALREGESSIPRDGFAWLGTDNRLARIIELTRNEIARGRNPDRVLTSLLTDTNPDFLTSRD